MWKRCQEKHQSTWIKWPVCFLARWHGVSLESDIFQGSAPTLGGGLMNPCLCFLCRLYDDDGGGGDHDDDDNAALMCARKPA